MLCYSEQESCHIPEVKQQRCMAVIPVEKELILVAFN